MISKSILPLIDFHTHIDRGQPLAVPENVIRIVSVPAAEADLDLPENCFATLEQHPWNGELWNGNFARLAGSSRFIGIGEVGLDRLKGKLPLAAQIDIFNQATMLAEALNKPLTIHCVKCFSELLQSYKSLKWQIPTIIHYFCGKLELARQLWRDTHFVLSLPPKIYCQQNLLDFLREHPEYLHRIVLETDDPHNGNIGEHYRTMANLLDIKTESLQQLMAEQFERLFNGRII